MQLSAPPPLRPCSPPSFCLQARRGCLSQPRRPKSAPGLSCHSWPAVRTPQSWWVRLCPPFLLQRSPPSAVQGLAVAQTLPPSAQPQLEPWPWPQPARRAHWRTTRTPRSWWVRLCPPPLLQRSPPSAVQGLAVAQTLPPSAQPQPPSAQPQLEPWPWPQPARRAHWRTSLRAWPGPPPP